MLPKMMKIAIQMPPLFFISFWQQLFSIFHEISHDFHIKILHRKPLFSFNFQPENGSQNHVFFIQLRKVINFEKPQKTLLLAYKTAISQFPTSARIQNQAFENQHGKCIENATENHQKTSLDTIFPPKCCECAGVKRFWMRFGDFCIAFPPSGAFGTTLGTILASFFTNF